MKNLIIKGTGSLPSINFNANGNIKIGGRAFPEDAHKLFKPLFEWVHSFTSDKADIEINLEYFNTAVSKQLLDFLKAFETNPKISEIKVTWMYEEGDDEMLETGEIFEELLTKIQFTYKQYAEITE